MASDAELLQVQFQTRFAFSPLGRIEREGDPDRSQGPRFALAGCAAGNVAGVGAEVADGVAAELMALAAEEPPFVDPKGRPEHLARYLALLSRDGTSPGPVLSVQRQLVSGRAQRAQTHPGFRP